jgi:hypothetical protein
VIAAQMALLSHREAPEGMVAEPALELQHSPPPENITAAIRRMNDEHFIVLLSLRADIDVLSDPDALVVEYGDGHGFMLYQAAFINDGAAKAWHSRSAENVCLPSVVNIDDVLRVVASYCNGASFENLVEQFPDL